MNWHSPSLLSKDDPLRRIILLINVIMPTLFGVYAAVATLVVQTSIVGGLSIDGAFVPWITILYLLGINTIVPVANRLADRIGYKLLYFLGILLFTLGTLGVCLASEFYFLGFSRLLQGIGSGMVFPIGMGIIVRNFEGKALSLALNLYLGLGFGGGMVLGALVPGYFGMYHLWQDAFWFILPFSLFALLITTLFHYESEKITRGRFDYFGFLFFALFISTFLIALSEGALKSTAEGWRSPFILACFLLSFISFILVIIIENRTDNPIIPLPLFKDAKFTIGCATLFALGMAIFSSIGMMVKFMEQGLMYNKFTTGINLITYGITMGVFSILSSFLMKKISPTLLSIIGLSLVIGSLFLNNILTIQSGKIAIFFILLLKGAGIGLALGPVTTEALQNLPKENQTDGATLLTFFRQVGGTYGGSILGIIFIKRQIFHDLFFSQTINPHLPGYQYTLGKLKNHLINGAGLNPQEASYQAHNLIVNTVKKQSLIQSINDSLLAFGVIISLITLILIIVNLLSHKKVSNEKSS